MPTISSQSQLDAVSNKLLSLTTYLMPYLKKEVPCCFLKSY